MIGVNEIDRSVWEFFVEHRGASLTVFFEAVTWLCNFWTVVVVTTLTGIGLLVRSHRWLTVALVGTVVGAWLTTTALKLIVHRQRPPIAERLIEVSEYSFPSGHATQSVALYGSLAALLFAWRRSGTWRSPGGIPTWLYVFVWCVVAILVGMSRMYLGVHYLTDVIAGWVVGSSWWMWWWLVWYPRRAQADTPDLGAPQYTGRL